MWQVRRLGLHWGRNALRNIQRGMHILNEPTTQANKVMTKLLHGKTLPAVTTLPASLGADLLKYLLSICVGSKPGLL